MTRMEPQEYGVGLHNLCQVLRVLHLVPVEAMLEEAQAILKLGAAANPRLVDGRDDRGAEEAMQAFRKDVETLTAALPLRAQAAKMLAAIEAAERRDRPDGLSHRQN